MWFYVYRRQTAARMERLTVRVPEDLLEEIEDREDRENVSTSEATRQLLRRGVEANDLECESKERIERLEQEIERLRREKRLILEQREENRELVRYASTEKAYREAGLGTRMKWFLFGRGEE